MPRRKKRLVDLVRDGTFQARKDFPLLAGRERLPWPDLEKLRRRYRAAPPPDEAGTARRRIGLELERGIAEHGPERYLGLLRDELEKLGPRDSIERLLGFAPRFFRHQEGSLHGRPYRFPPNHEAFLREFWRRDRYGRRIYQVGLLMEPKGCSKTPSSGVLGAYTLVDEPDSPNVYVTSGAKKQANYCHGFVKANIEQGALAAWLNVRGETVEYPENWGEFEIQSAEGDLSAGAIPSGSIFDELFLFRHRHQREAWNSHTKALHKRSGRSWALAISTAGWSKDTLLGEMYDGAVAHPRLEVLDDGYHLRLRDEDAGFLFWCHEIPQDADIEDPAVIRRGTPAPWIKPRDLLRELHRPDSDELDWRRLHGNQWTKTRRSWLASGVWARLFGETQIPVGGQILVGIDAARTWDTTAVAWLWRSPDGRKVVRAHVWSVRQDVPHHTFVRGGELVNEEIVEPFVYELAKHFRIRAIALDQRYLTAESKHLADAGFTVVKVEAQSSQMADAVTLTEKDALGQMLEHDGDRVVSLHVEAIDSVRRPDGSKKVGARNERDPVDAGFAIILANLLTEVELPDPQSGWRVL